MPQNILFLKFRNTTHVFLEFFMTVSHHSLFLNHHLRRFENLSIYSSSSKEIAEGFLLKQVFEIYAFLISQILFVNLHEY